MSASVSYRGRLRAAVRQLPPPLPGLLRLLRDLAKGALPWGAFALAYPYLAIRRARRRLEHDRLAQSRQKVILFLAPEAGLIPFHVTQVILARTLREAGHAVIILSCDGIKPICSLKFAMQMAPTSAGDTANAACRRCRRQVMVTGERYRLPDITIESLLGPEQHDTIAAVMAANAAAPWDTVHDGIAFGRAAVAETVRARRKLDVSEFDDDDRALIAALVQASLAVHFAVGALASRFAIRRIAYFGDYAYWIAPQLFAERNGIALSHLDHAYNRDTDWRYIGLRPGHANADMLVQVAHWLRHRDKPITPDVVHRVAESALFRMRGHGGVSTYSPNFVRGEGGLIEELGLKPGRSTIVAYSSSSDEFLCIRDTLCILGRPYAVGAKPFADQHEWLRALVDWVAARDDVQLVIRLHPRMAPSYRHPTMSTQYVRLKRELQDLPGNVAVIWAESKTSSYNLAELADLVLVAWSNMALEMARFGVPALAAFPNIAPYPTGSFIAFEETPGAYFGTLEALLGRAASLDVMTEVFRWSNYIHWSPVVDVSDLVRDFNYERVPAWRRPANHAIIERVLAGDENLSELNMARLPRGAGAIDEERRAIVATAVRFARFFLIGDSEPVAPEAAEAIIRSIRAGPDAQVEMNFDGRSVERRSPLVHRLAVMLRDTECVDAIAAE